MFDIHAENAADRRPAIVVCIYETNDPARPLVDEALRASSMAGGTRTIPISPDDPAVLADLITDTLQQAECRGVLLVGRTRRSDGFRVQMRAENRTLCGEAKWSSIGPAMARSTAPVAEIIRDLTEAGLAAAATSESEDDAGSYLLYRILTAMPDDADARAVALLRAPVALGPDEVRKGVEIGTGALGRHLTPLPRERPV
jgi:hypothetical protein